MNTFQLCSNFIAKILRFWVNYGHILFFFLYLFSKNWLGNIFFVKKFFSKHFCAPRDGWAVGVYNARQGFAWHALDGKRSRDAVLVKFNHMEPGELGGKHVFIYHQGVSLSRSHINSSNTNIFFEDLKIHYSPLESTWWVLLNELKHCIPLGRKINKKFIWFLNLTHPKPFESLWSGLWNKYKHGIQTYFKKWSLYTEFVLL